MVPSEGCAAPAVRGAAPVPRGVLFAGSYGVVRRMLYVACCTLHGVRCVLYVACCTLRAIRCMVYVAWCTLHGLRCVVYVACDSDDRVPRRAHGLTRMAHIRRWAGGDAPCAHALLCAAPTGPQRADPGSPQHTPTRAQACNRPHAAAAHTPPNALAHGRTTLQRLHAAPRAAYNVQHAPGRAGPGRACSSVCCAGAPRPRPVPLAACPSRQVDHDGEPCECGVDLRQIATVLSRSLLILWAGAAAVRRHNTAARTCTVQRIPYSAQRAALNVQR